MIDGSVELLGEAAQIFEAAEYVIEFYPDDPWETDEWEVIPNSNGYTERRSVLYEKDDNQGRPLFDARMREWPDGKVELLVVPHEKVKNEMDFNVGGEEADGLIVETNKKWNKLKFSIYRE